MSDIVALKASDIVYVHVNDAPAGIAVDDQVDNRRLLPGDSGVIDLNSFFDSVRATGYNGPVCVEPFLDSLADLEDDAARLTVVGESLKKFVP